MFRATTITTVFSPFLAVLPNESGDPIEQKGDIPLDEFLDNFFKGSPWRVTVKKLQGRDWYVWQRVEDGKPIHPMIYLAPVSEEGSPFIFRTPSLTSDLLMIKVSESVLGYYIDESNTLHPIEFKDRCAFPTYIVIPQGPKLVDGAIKWATREDEKYSEHDYTVQRTELSDLDPYITVNGFRGILYGVETSCLAGIRPPPPEKKEPPVPPLPPAPTIPVPEPGYGGEVPPFPYGEEGTTCFIYDASGSVARYDIENYNKKAAEMVARQVSQFVASHIGLVAEYYKKYSDDKVDEELKKIKLSFRIYLINQNETAKRDVAISFADAVDFASLQRYAGLLDGTYSWDSIGNSSRVALQILLDPGSLIKEDAVDAIVEREVNIALGSAKFLVGGDDPAEVDLAISTCKKKDAFVYFTDEAPDVSVSPPAMIENFHDYSSTIPAEDGTKRIKDAFDKRIPIFLSIVLNDEPLKKDLLSTDFKNALREIDTEEEAIGIANQESPKEIDLFTAIGKLTELEETKRKGLYDRLIAIARDERYDVHVTKRAIALAAFWAIKGDSKAKETLFRSFLAVEKLPSITGQVFLAKCVAAIIDDLGAETLLKMITKDPEGRENYLYLIALSSNDKFLTALQFMMDHVWTYRIIKNQEKANLLIALLVLFSDPAVRYEYPDEMRKDVLNILAGGGWTPERLQEAFETFAGGVLPVLAAETAPAVGMMATFAIKILQPEWKERKMVELNPIPRERFFYHLSKEGFERNVGQLVKNAKWEEGWLAFYTHNDSLQVETGLLSSQGSTVVNVDWDFVEKGVSKPLIVIDYHIHPWHDTSIPIKMSAFPSGADFFNWFGKLCELRRRYPKAQIEFRIISPQGVTVIKPKENFLEELDAIIELDTKGLRYIPKEYTDAVMKYETYVHEYLDTARLSGMWKITGYFGIEVPKVEDEGVK